MRRYLDLNDRAFNAIQARRKRVEIRANTKNHDYSKYEVGDVIVFKNSKSNTINCKITEINKYESVEELLMHLTRLLHIQYHLLTLVLIKYHMWQSVFMEPILIQ